MITNEEIADKCVDCENCKHLHKNNCNLHKQNCIKCDKFVEKALELKDKQIKEAIESLMAEIDCKTQQNMPTSTKTIYIAAQLIVKEAINMLKQKLNLED